MYSLADRDGEGNKKVKWVSKSAVGTVRYKKFVLFGEKLMTHRMKRIQSKLYRIGTYVCKSSWSCFYDKRYILDDGINSLAYFHKDVRSQWEMQPHNDFAHKKIKF